MTFNHVGMEIGFLSNIFHIFILRFSKSIMLNTNLDEKIDIVKGYLEEFLEKNLPNLLQLYQLLEPFHHYLQLPFKLKINIRPTIILYRNSPVGLVYRPELLVTIRVEPTFLVTDKIVSVKYRHFWSPQT